MGILQASFFLSPPPPVASVPHLCSVGAPGDHAVVSVWLEFGLHLKEKSVGGVTMKKKMKKKEQNSSNRKENTREGPGVKN